MTINKIILISALTILYSCSSNEFPIELRYVGFEVISSEFYIMDEYQEFKTYIPSSQELMDSVKNHENFLNSNIIAEEKLIFGQYIFENDSIISFTSNGDKNSVLYIIENGKIFGENQDSSIMNVSDNLRELNIESYLSYQAHSLGSGSYQIDGAFIQSSLDYLNNELKPEIAYSGDIITISKIEFTYK